MLEKGRKTIITFCTSIIILFILCLIIVLINLFTNDTIKKETIVGINPIALVESMMTYQEPLTVTLKEERKENVKEEKEEEIIQNVEETIENREYEEVNTNIILEGNYLQQKEQAEKTIESNIQQNIEQTEIEEKKEPILTQYQGFTTVGKIEIPKTGVDIPILNQVTVEGMKNAPCLLYETGELNQNGNSLIVGHNFRNNTLFSNNKKLNLGDKVYITTLDGNRVEYTIYDKFVTTAEDVDYIKRETNNKPEITLSCCTDDDVYRIVILAKVI